MKIARVATPVGPRAGIVDGDVIRPPTAAELLPPLPGLEQVLEAPVSLTTARLLAPVIPGKVCCIGRNYAAHAAELGNAVPSRPLLFHKPASAVIGPGDTILLPPDSERVEHEAELAVVIGRRCRHVQKEHWATAVAGFTALNDVTARDLQRADKQFARGKGFDTFCPVGPWIETDLDPTSLKIACRVDGDTRQSGTTSDMIFDVPTLIAAVSRIMTLEPGDLIATGTPDGVSLLRAGETVEVSIEGIGTLSNPVQTDDDVPPG